MGLYIENNQIRMTDAAGNERFTTAKRMSHLLYSASGTINVPNVQGTSTYVAGVGYAGDPYASWTGSTANFTQDFTVITEAGVSAADSFAIPFFKVTNGDIDTGTGAITGSGSAILRIFVDGSGYYRGVSTLTPLVIGQSVVLRVQTTIQDDAGGLVNHPPSALGSVASGQTVPVQFLNTNYTIGYRVYYGRFT